MINAKLQPGNAGNVCERCRGRCVLRQIVAIGSPRCPYLHQVSKNNFHACVFVNTPGRHAMGARDGARSLTARLSRAGSAEEAPVACVCMCACVLARLFVRLRVRSFVHSFVCLCVEVFCCLRVLCVCVFPLFWVFLPCAWAFDVKILTAT